ncbi:hypothetical protein [Roseovarius sp.]|uniref:hypothetical protein n=1 Tax=Roseovarius sp. TaxID=1486281 RepID=UPI003A974F14
MSGVTPPNATKGHLHHINTPLFALISGFIALFCLIALFDPDLLSRMVDAGLAWSAKYFGHYRHLLLLATYLIGLALVVLPGGRAIIGGLLAGGGAFRATFDGTAQF